MSKNSQSIFSIIILLITIVSCNDNEDDLLPGELIEKDPKIVLTNEGSVSWKIVEIEGSGITAALDQPNQTITLVSGQRYSFINLGGASHPLDFRSADNEILLSQDLNLGTFEDDPEVDFVFDFNEDLAEFTLTDKLAAELASYNCSFHDVMKGAIIVN